MPSQVYPWGPSMRTFSDTGRSVVVLLAATMFWTLILAAGVAEANYKQAKLWFEAQSSPNRIALQIELYWSGDYAGPIDDRFGPQTYASLIAFQSRFGASRTGVLSASERAVLRREAQRVRQLVHRAARRNVGTNIPKRSSVIYVSAHPIVILP